MAHVWLTPDQRDYDKAIRDVGAPGRTRSRIPLLAVLAIIVLGLALLTEKLFSTHRQMKNQLAVAAARTQGLESELSGVQLTLEGKTRELAGYITMVTAWEQERTALVAQTQKLQVGLAERNRTHEADTKQLNEISAKLSKFQAENQSQLGTIQNLQTRAASAEARASSAQARVSDLEMTSTRITPDLQPATAVLPANRQEVGPLTHPVQAPRVESSLLGAAYGVRNVGWGKVQGGIPLIARTVPKPVVTLPPVYVASRPIAPTVFSLPAPRVVHSPIQANSLRAASRSFGWSSGAHSPAVWQVHGGRNPSVPFQRKSRSR